MRFARFFLGASLLMTVACGPKAVPTDTRPLVVQAFNVMCSFCPSPGLDAWATRLPELDAAIARFDADLVGLQELFTEEDVDHVLDAFPAYDTFYYVDPGTDGAPLPAYPDAAIFWRRDRFRLIEGGTLWLSPTPDVAWSAGFSNGQVWRLLVWTELEQISDGRHLLFASTHFDNNSPSQVMSAPLTVERIGGRIAELPVLLLGDFNSDLSSEAYAILAKTFADAYEETKTHPQITTETPPPAWNPPDRIDHIFYSPEDFSTESHTVDLSRYGDPPRFPSDHWPIGATLNWAVR